MQPTTRSIPRAVLGAGLLIYSVVGLIGAWRAAQPWWGAMYGVIAVAALRIVIARPSSTPRAIPTVTGPWEAEARQILANGNKIGAITAVRRATTLGLADAKALVDSWERDPAGPAQSW